MYKELRDKLVDAYVGSIPLITINIIWFFTSLPIVTLIPATAALFYATNRLAHGKSADYHIFFEGFRLYWRRSFLWGGLNVIVAVLVVSNFLFYRRFAGNLASIATAILLVISLLWLSLQVYTFPLVLEQEQPRLRLALRNSLILLIKRPIYTMAAALFMTLMAVVSTLVIQPGWIFVTASGCAYVANLATLSSIAKVNGKRPGANPDSPPTESTMPLEGSE
jgi:uncharacterized membrane protein YesL